jgi:hypothetical protein
MFIYISPGDFTLIHFWEYFSTSCNIGYFLHVLIDISILILTISMLETLFEVACQMLTGGNGQQSEEWKNKTTVAGRMVEHFIPSHSPHIKATELSERC